MAKPLVYRDGEPFPGRAAATLVESVPAWPVPARAPAGAPNVVLVVLDDVGFAQIGCTTVSSPQPLAPGRHVVGVALEPASGNGMRVELVVGGDVVAVGEAPRTAPFRFALAGEGLCCGYDDGTAVADVYESPYAFTGTIHEAVIDVSGTPVLDLVAELRRAWMTQ